MINNVNEENLDFVSSYFTQKKEKEIVRLKKEIEETRAQVQFLKKEVSVLKVLDEDPDEFFDFALDQSNLTVNKLQQIVEDLYSGNPEKEEELIKAHEIKMSELTDKIQAGKEYAFEILNEIMEKTSSLDEEELNLNTEIDSNKTEDININMSEDTNENKREEKINREDFKETKIVQGFWDENESGTELVDNQTDKFDTEYKPNIDTNKNVPNQKYMYVLGKIAGSDLYDKSGKLIVAKDEIITPEITKKAEDEGKIIELVLEMKLSEG